MRGRLRTHVVAQEKNTELGYLSGIRTREWRLTSDPCGEASSACSVEFGSPLAQWPLESSSHLPTPSSLRLGPCPQGRSKSTLCPLKAMMEPKRTMPLQSARRCSSLRFRSHFSHRSSMHQPYLFNKTIVKRGVPTNEAIGA